MNTLMEAEKKLGGRREVGSQGGPGGGRPRGANGGNAASGKPPGSEGRRWRKGADVGHGCPASTQ